MTCEQKNKAAAVWRLVEAAYYTRDIPHCYFSKSDADAQGEKS